MEFRFNFIVVVLFVSGCYMMVSIAYVVGFLMKDAISCKEFNDHKVSSDDCVA